jgi:succinate dehydrogenase / fumarate reductase cytochrome b subunit
MSNTERPLSPHISIYRWPLTMILSILHRATGLAMSAGLIVFAWWLLSVARGGAPYENVVAVLTTPLGRLFLIGWSFAFFLHLANGVRHLFWDFGYGFEQQRLDAFAWIVVSFAILLTASFWWVM